MSDWENCKLIAERLVTHTQTEAAKVRSGEEAFTGDPEANELILTCPLAFVLACLFDEGVPAPFAWGYPCLLKKRLADLDVPFTAKGLAGVSEDNMVRVFLSTHRRVRYPQKMACWTRRLARRLVKEYGGDAANLWSDCPPAHLLQARLLAFDGMGQKKASMAANILSRDLGIPLADRTTLDISVDKHIRQVFLRAGLVPVDDAGAIIMTARALRPEYPGELDLGAWKIGRDCCFNERPNCSGCPLDDLCPKITALAPGH